MRNKNGEWEAAMELRVLRYFLAIAEEGNITSASARLHVGQPTLSRQIKDLERELGQPLVERQSHGVRLTTEGQLLRGYAEEMVEIADRVLAEFGAMRNKPLGDVYIGGAETDQLRSLAAPIRRARASQPTMRVHFTAGNLADLASKLDRGLIDFAILSQPANLSKYETIDLPVQESWVVYTRQDSPLARKKKLTRDDLAGEPLIMSEQVASKRAAGNNVAEWFGDAFDQLNIVATFNLMYGAAAFAKEGLGSLLTWDKLVSVPDEGELVSIPLEPPLYSWLALAWPRDRQLSPAAKHFLEAMGV